jgi:hypothetical protein
MLNGSLFFRMVKKGKQMIFKVLLYAINKAMEEKNWNECPLEEIVPKQYHQFLRLYSNIMADRIQPHRPCINHEV